MKVIGTDRGIAYITELDDWIKSLHNLNSECKNYTESELRYQEIIQEYKNKIRADAIDKVIEFLKCEFIKQNNPHSELVPTIVLNIGFIETLEQLKEHKNDSN